MCFGLTCYPDTWLTLNYHLPRSETTSSGLRVLRSSFFNIYFSTVHVNHCPETCHSRRLGSMGSVEVPSLGLFFEFKVGFDWVRCTVTSLLIDTDLPGPTWPRNPYWNHYLTTTSMGTGTEGDGISSDLCTFQSQTEWLGDLVKNMLTMRTDGVQQQKIQLWKPFLI